MTTTIFVITILVTYFLEALPMRRMHPQHQENGKSPSKDRSMLGKVSFIIHTILVIIACFILLLKIFRAVPWWGKDF